MRGKCDEQLSLSTTNCSAHLLRRVLGVLGRAVIWAGGFVERFLRAPQLFGTVPAAQSSKEYSQKKFYKTSYPSNGLS